MCARFCRLLQRRGWEEKEETQKESISFEKHRSRLKSERGTKEKRPSNEKEWRGVYKYIHSWYTAVHTLQRYTRVTGVVLLMKMKRERERREWDRGKNVLQYDLGKTLVFPQWTLLFLLPYIIQSLYNIVCIYRLVPSSFSEYFYFNFSLNSAASRVTLHHSCTAPSEKKPLFRLCGINARQTFHVSNHKNAIPDNDDCGDDTKEQAESSANI